MENENFFEEPKVDTEENVDVIVPDSPEDVPVDNAPVEETVNLDLPPVAPTPAPPSEQELLKKEKRRKKRKVYKVFYIIMLCFVGFATFVLMLAGMISFMDKILSSEEVIDIDDSFKLEDLSDDEIIDKNEYFIADSNKFITNGFDYSDADYDYDKYDRPECYFEATSLNGVRTVSVTGTSESDIIFLIKSELVSGKAKIVITSESEILATLEMNEQTFYTITCEEDEQIFVKVIGEDASFNVTVVRNIVGINENPDA